MKYIVAHGEELTACPQLNLVQDLRMIAPEQVAEEQGPGVVEGVKSDGGFLTPIWQALLSVTSLKLVSQLPQNLRL